MFQEILRLTETIEYVRGKVLLPTAAVPRRLERFCFELIYFQRRKTFGEIKRDTFTGGRFD